MADTVTYADVRFVKRPEAPDRRPRRTDLCQNGDIIYADIKTQGTGSGPVMVNNDMEENGGIAYANIQGIQESSGKTIPGSSGTCGKGCWRGLSPYTTRILLAISVLLLASTAALGVRLSQVSAWMVVSTQRLQELQQERENLNINLEQVTGINEKTQGSLRGTKQLLDQNQEQLHHTEEKLRESEERLRETQANLRSREQELDNSKNKAQGTIADLQQSEKKYKDLLYKYNQVQLDLQQCRSDLKKCQDDLTNTGERLNRVTEESRTYGMKLNKMKRNLKNAKEMVTEGEYFFATPCMNTLLAMAHFSESAQSFEYCQRDWTLISGKCYFLSEDKKSRSSSEQACASLEGQLAVVKQNKNLQELIKSTSQQYWIGLKWEKDSRQWEWSDGTEFTLSYRTSYTCMKVKYDLMPELCYESLRYICEKPASTCASGESFQSCFRK